MTGWLLEAVRDRRGRLRAIFTRDHMHVTVRCTLGTLSSVHDPPGCVRQNKTHQLLRNEQSYPAGLRAEGCTMD